MVLKLGVLMESRLSADDVNRSMRTNGGRYCLSTMELGQLGLMEDLYSLSTIKLGQ